MSTTGTKKLGETNLLLLDDPEELCSWLVDISVKKETINHPDNFDNYNFSQDTQSSKLLVIDFKRLINNDQPHGQINSLSKQTLSRLSMFYDLILYPILNHNNTKMINCHAAYMTRTLVDDLRDELFTKVF
ncbi:TPA: hypothetical protein ACX6RO_001805 [Photobacterium damselae]